MALPPALQLGVDPAARRPLRDEAYLTLRRAILAGEFLPGDRLVEREVAAKLNLSRSPVREAFRRLEQEGLVSVSRQGLFVHELDAQEIEELYVIREQLESCVARLAARRFTADHRPLIEEGFQDMSRAAESGDQEEMAAAGARFHRLLAEIAGNRRLARLAGSVAEEIDRFRRLNLSLAPRTQIALDEHRRLLDAVAAQDEDAAERLMSEHVSNSLQVARLHARRSE